jgi:hypothetical protein
MSRCPGGGATSTERSTSLGRSSTCTCPRGEMVVRPGVSSPGAGQHESHPVEVTTDWAELYPHVLDELAPGCLALYEGLRHQPNGSRPRAAEAAPATGAWPEKG